MLGLTGWHTGNYRDLALEADEVVYGLGSEVVRLRLEAIHGGLGLSCRSLSCFGF